MATKMDQLLESIHPSRTIEAIARRCDQAINGFPADHSQITDWETFRVFVVTLCRHVDATILRLRGGPPDFGLDYDWGRYVSVLTKAFGSSGEKTAFEMARTGNEGGLYAVLKKLALTLAEQYAENEIAARVWTYWNELTVDEKLAAADEYLAKHGHLLPSELTEGCAGRVRANLPKVLQQHPEILHRLSRIGRS